MNGVVVSLIIGVLTLIIGVLLLYKDVILHKSRKSFIVVGPSFSGKTSLYQLLSLGKASKYTPVMSQKPSEVTNYKLPLENVNDEYVLREYPGNSKLLNLYLYRDLKDKSFLKNVKGIIFMVDSSNFDAFEVSRMLFEILTQTELLPNGVDILLACNKQDLFQSKPVFKIRQLLETEMNNLKENSLKNLNKVDSDEVSEFNNVDNFLSSVGKFSFDQLQGNFDFIQGSVLKGQVDKWECWIAERGVN